MIEVIKNWIVSVVTAVIFMVLVDMLLPSNSMKKYAKITTGLIVIIIILTPVFKLFDRNVSIETYVSKYMEDLQQNSTDFENIDLRNKVEKQRMDVFKSNLVKEIEKEIFYSTGKRYEISSINVNEDKDSYEYTKITSIELKQREDTEKVKRVEKIVISQQQDEQEAQKDERVVKLLREKFNVNPETIKFLK
ncbi:hypothetical protein Q428_01465 [Fervidicella metallireducens AeB]|uniref:Stage III sporulation protein AF n=1 Tax=Fervidicella metallireducens AeB TaxID=1403537 RepID=A0A017RYS0_9CLOT|nr:stage III sporulation protein AF [Fervidicella metallireducens]EYE89741.1 hypothetical protein Q428_01465 [Fervidicella metallireducens AeB]